LLSALGSPFWRPLKLLCVQSLPLHVSQSPQHRSPPSRFPSQPLLGERCSISKALLDMSYLAFRVPSKASLPPSRFPLTEIPCFGCNASYSGKIFTLQKKILSIMADAQPRTLCRTIRDSAYSMPVYTFINELHYQ